MSEISSANLESVGKKRVSGRCATRHVGKRTKKRARKKVSAKKS